MNPSPNFFHRGLFIASMLVGTAAVLVPGINILGALVTTKTLLGGLGIWLLGWSQRRPGEGPPPVSAAFPQTASGTSPDETKKGT